MDDDDMAWVRFTEDFDWDPQPRVTITYKAGGRYSVKRACADAAKAAGKAVDDETPSRGSHATMLALTAITAAVAAASEAETPAPEEDDGGQAPGTV